MQLTCVRALVRLEMRALGVDLVAALRVALVYLSVLIEIIEAAAIGGGVATERGAAARTAAAEIDAAEATAAAAVLTRPAA